MVGRTCRGTVWERGGKNIVSLWRPPLWTSGDCFSFPQLFELLLHLPHFRRLLRCSPFCCSLPDPCVVALLIISYSTSRKSHGMVEVRAGNR